MKLTFSFLGAASTGTHHQYQSPTDGTTCSLHSLPGVEYEQKQNKNKILKNHFLIREFILGSDCMFPSFTN